MKLVSLADGSRWRLYDVENMAQPFPPRFLTTSYRPQDANVRIDFELTNPIGGMHDVNVVAICPIDADELIEYHADSINGHTQKARK